MKGMHHGTVGTLYKRTAFSMFAIELKSNIRSDCVPLGWC